MSREAKWLVGFLVGVVAAFVGEHIWLVTRESPPSIDPAIQLCRIVK